MLIVALDEGNEFTCGFIEIAYTMGPQANDAATPSRWRVNLSSASEGAKAMPSPLGYVPADAVSNVEARRRAKEEKEDAFARAPRAPDPAAPRRARRR